MADYIYLLQNRLSLAQQTALQSIRDLAKARGLTVFLVGGAVRDLTSGSPVHDLDVVVQGNALTLKKDLEAGAVLTGEVPAWQALYARYPGGVRVEIGSTLSVTYPKPGKPVMQPATILEDLRRRDFTVNAMALSLNEGSYGLLMDPLNGVADIENRQLRLVSNYGFIEDPVRMLRATRFAARLGWTMDEKTQARYDTGKTEKYISALSALHRGYESEEIFHEEDPLRILRKLEEEGWMKHLFPALTIAKANVIELEKLREVQTQLQVSGIHPDASTAHFPLLTAKLSATELAELKKSFVRQGFVAEVEALETDAKEFASQLSGKGTALPSQAWKLIHGAKPEAVLWAAYSSKSATVQSKLKSFQTEWPKARQKMPYALMQEMRIVPDLEGFNDVVEKVFFELMDGKLTTPEEQKAFLEPFSPPAPPPAVHLRRSRAAKKDAKGAKGKKKMAALVDEDDDDADLDGTLPDEEDLSSSADEDDDEVMVPVNDAFESDSDLELASEPAPPVELEQEDIEPEPVPAPPSPPAKKKKLVADEPEAVTALETDTLRVSTKKKAAPLAASAGKQPVNVEGKRESSPKKGASPVHSAKPAAEKQASKPPIEVDINPVVVQKAPAKELSKKTATDQTTAKKPR